MQILEMNILRHHSHKQYYIICGLEFGLDNLGKFALVHRSLYGGKSADFFTNHIASCMMNLDFVSYPADQDIWMRPAKKSDDTSYYE